MLVSVAHRPVELREHARGAFRHIHIKNRRVPPHDPCFLRFVIISLSDCTLSHLEAPQSVGSVAKMKYFAFAVVMLLLLVQVMSAVPYPPPIDRNLSEDYNDNMENILLRNEKRACIRRGGSCDNKPNDCCANSACRCNLWGTNCRCERAGLFQQWGK